MTRRARPWARVRAEQTTADLLVFGPIGASWWDDDTITAADVVRQLAALPPTVKTIRVRINSEGGSPFDAIAIHSELRRQASEHGRHIQVRVEGLAASAASVIATAGDERLIAPAGLIMIHDGWTITVGDIGEHQRSITALTAVGDAIVESYLRVSSDDEAAIRAAMTAETWYGADDAIAHGYATGRLDAAPAEEEDAPAVDARIASRWRRAPAAQIAAWLPAPAPVPLAAADVVELVARARLGVEFAQALIGEDLPRDVVEARIAAAVRQREEAETQAREAAAAAATRAQQIRTLCNGHASTRALADLFIASGADAQSVGLVLAHMLAQLDTVEIDTSLPVDGHRGGRGAIDVGAIYVARNAGRTY